MDNIIKELAEQAGIGHRLDNPTEIWGYDKDLEKFAELIVKECIDKIETYQIPVGNSAAGEMASEWTHEALIAIRDDIKEHFGVE